VKKPSRRIDYAWITKDTVVPLKMEVLQSEASDHLPIIAELSPTFARREDRWRRTRYLRGRVGSGRPHKIDCHPVTGTCAA
jgi:hypothetical protein